MKFNDRERRKNVKIYNSRWKKLEGEIKISGSKNAALPIIAATVLNAGTTTLYNVPDIQDVNTMFEILKK